MTVSLSSAPPNEKEKHENEKLHAEEWQQLGPEKKKKRTEKSLTNPYTPGYMYGKGWEDTCSSSLGEMCIKGSSPCVLHGSALDARKIR